MIFRQLCTRDRIGALAYLLGDPVTREAVIIDPLPPLVEELEDFTRQRGLHLRYCMQTHHDEGHVAAAQALRESHGARLLAHEEVRSNAVDVRVRDGDVIYFGEERLRVIHLPGLSPCAVAFAWEDRLFTGLTLLANGLNGRLRGRARTQARKLVESRILSFAGETLLYPSREIRGRRLASVAELRCQMAGKGPDGGSGHFLRRCALLINDKKTEAASPQEDRPHQDTANDLQRYAPGFYTPASS